jgi:hypothetical protein
LFGWIILDWTTAVGNVGIGIIERILATLAGWISVFISSDKTVAVAVLAIVAMTASAVIHTHSFGGRFSFLFCRRIKSLLSSHVVLDRQQSLGGCYQSSIDKACHPIKEIHVL